MKSNTVELAGHFKQFTINSSFVNSYIISAHQSPIKNSYGEKPVFLYRVLKLISSSKISEGRYLEDIKKQLVSVPIPNKKLKLECIDINSRRGYSAKDIEVYLGNSLEKLGANINIKKPELLCYIVLFDMNCYIGFESYKKLPFVDPGRHYKALSSGISRAEFKLMEAFDEFKLKVRKGNIAIDLGAAPGGWSAFLAKKGFKVVAIDQGELNSKRISELGLRYLNYQNSENKYKDNGVLEHLEETEILHIKSKFQDAITMLNGRKKASIITCDMNISPSEAATAVLLFKDLLRVDAVLIFTIKCTTLYVKRFVDDAVSVLSKEFKIIKILALPNNRQELTLYAIKKKR